ncbi:helix-turn-helix transcriptional regulator [Pseudomonas aeruginosa]|uniref:helix-turn-helix transcriptional regulator n=1 Tax=Pseudomonas aeruginosa TaxID=287 RepID=UPI001067AEE4|nr:LuxR family transcriptional regulator [Pseudomonas aeruginosa]TEE53901.1 LuxR family transcriptional regulator [Pseudomonas aeruginosa]
MALVDGFLELERSSGKLEWSAILQKMASDLGFSKILFGLLPKDSQDYENAFIVGNYPAAWREHYDRAGYARVDPTVSHCTQSVLPIFWEPSIYQTRKQHEFFEEASAAGLAFEHPVSKPVVLTSREKEVLQWCAIGKTSWEISVICNCSEANVNFHMGNIRRKFGVTSRRVAAIMAVNLGLITL